MAGHRTPEAKAKEKAGCQSQATKKAEGQAVKPNTLLIEAARRSIEEVRGRYRGVIENRLDEMIERYTTACETARGRSERQSHWKFKVYEAEQELRDFIVKNEGRLPVRFGAGLT